MSRPPFRSPAAWINIIVCGLGLALIAYMGIWEIVVALHIAGAR